jgi:hypothetical protein
MPPNKLIRSGGQLGAWLADLPGVKQVGGPAPQAALVPCFTTTLGKMTDPSCNSIDRSSHCVQVRLLAGASSGRTRQRFYPQCQRCSIKQATALRNNARVLVLHLATPRYRSEQLAGAWGIRDFGNTHLGTLLHTNQPLSNPPDVVCTKPNRPHILSPPGVFVGMRHNVPPYVPPSDGGAGLRPSSRVRIINPIGLTADAGPPGLMSLAAAGSLGACSSASEIDYCYGLPEITDHPGACMTDMGAHHRDPDGHARVVLLPLRHGSASLAASRSSSVGSAAGGGGGGGRGGGGDLLQQQHQQQLAYRQQQARLAEVDEEEEEDYEEGDDEYEARGAADGTPRGEGRLDQQRPPAPEMSASFHQWVPRQGSYPQPHPAPGAAARPGSGESVGGGRDAAAGGYRLGTAAGRASDRHQQQMMQQQQQMQMQQRQYGGGRPSDDAQAEADARAGAAGRYGRVPGRGEQVGAGRGAMCF